MPGLASTGKRAGADTGWPGGSWEVDCRAGLDGQSQISRRQGLVVPARDAESVTSVLLRLAGELDALPERVRRALAGRMHHSDVP
jgi:hypothetical protein